MTLFRIALSAGLFFLLSGRMIFAQGYDTASIMDTIPYGKDNIVLYSNHYWEYAVNEEDFALDKAMADTMYLFRHNWNNDITFAYMHPDSAFVRDSLVLVLADSNRKFVLPRYGRINSGFGWRYGRAHKGLDVDLERGAPIMAAWDGKVRYAKYNTGGYGYLVIIRHFNGLETYYAHLTQINVKPNQFVKAGQLIGTGGNSGAGRAGTHLHWEIRWNDHAFDPLTIVDFGNYKLFKDTVVLYPKDFVMTQSHKAYTYPPGTQSTATTTTTSTTTTTTTTASNNSGMNVKVHIVRKGDTLSAIALKYGTTVDRLCQLNGISRTSTLQIGQKIKVR